jgi:hypothetical protein
MCGLATVLCIAIMLFSPVIRNYRLSVAIANANAKR